MACMEGRQQLALTGNQDTKMHFFWLDSGLRTAEVDSLGLGVGLEVRQGILQEFSELAPKAVKRKWPDFSREAAGRGGEGIFTMSFSPAFSVGLDVHLAFPWHFTGSSQPVKRWEGMLRLGGKQGWGLITVGCEENKLQTALKQHCSHRHWW